MTREPKPMDPEHRKAVYLRQTGRTTPTPRQRRRIDHKANKAAVRAAKAGA